MKLSFSNQYLSFSEHLLIFKTPIAEKVFFPVSYYEQENKYLPYKKKIVNLLWNKSCQ